MSEQASDRIWSGIDIPKTIAGTLAAVSAAVVGSFLGVATAGAVDGRATGILSRQGVTFAVPAVAALLR